MSMFKTLQSNPGIITLFHTLGKPSTPLLKTLLSAANPHSSPDFKKEEEGSRRSLWSYISKGKNEPPQLEKFQVEEIRDALPTYDQLNLLKSFAQSDSEQLKIFTKVFPHFVNPDSKIVIPEELESVELGVDKFTELNNQGDFNPPLVVDWEKGHIANDSKTLQHLLKPYR